MSDKAPVIQKINAHLNQVSYAACVKVEAFANQIVQEEAASKAPSKPASKEASKPGSKEVPPLPKPIGGDTVAPPDPAPPSKPGSKEIVAPPSQKGSKQAPPPPAPVAAKKAPAPPGPEPQSPFSPKTSPFFAKSAAPEISMKQKGSIDDVKALLSSMYQLQSSDVTQSAKHYPEDEVPEEAHMQLREMTVELIHDITPPSLGVTRAAIPPSYGELNSLSEEEQEKLLIDQARDKFVTINRGGVAV